MRERPILKTDDLVPFGDLAGPILWVLNVVLKSLDTEGSSYSSALGEAADGYMISLFGDEIRTAAC
jgi:hypothetical protein